MALVKCEECGKNISEDAKQCPNCGYVKKVKIICPECKAENDKKCKACKNCGAPLSKQNKFSIDLTGNKLPLIIAGVILLVVIGGIGLGIGLHNKKLDDIKTQEQEEYNSRPIKVDISMTSYYGTIEYILYELGLDFDLVTMGGNCMSGTQKGEFKTEKYGILHTEYRYCKSNSTLIFRVYNDEKDQPLREPKAGELPYFDKYGKRTNYSEDINAL